jgi:hypothetical protein
VLLLVGFLAGRASVRVDDRELADSLAVWKEHRKQDDAVLDSTRAIVLAERARGDSAESAASHWRSIADARNRTIADLRQRADAAGRDLANATTPADSLKACMVELVLRRGECAETARQNDDLRRAAQADTAAKAALRRENAAHLTQRGRDSTRLAEADGLIVRLEKAAGGCRVPLVGLPCPLAVAGYNLTVSRFAFGGGLPVKLGPIRGVAMVTWSP